MHAAHAETPVSMARDRMIGLIREAGRTPVERDALYNIVATYDESKRVPALP